MTEREVNTGEQEPHRQDVIELARGVDAYFKQASEDAIQLSWQRFGTEEEAHAAATQLAKYLDEAGEGVEALGGMPVRIIGSEVKVSNIHIEQADGGIITTTINTENPYVEVGPFGAEPIGRIRMLIPATGQDDTGHIATLHAMFEDAKPTGAHIMANTLPVAEVDITRYVLAPLASTEFSVPILEQYDTRSRALSQVVFRSVEDRRNSVQDALEKIKVAIDDASVQHDFIPFDQIEHLHELAKVSEDHVDVATVMDAMRDILGKDRPIQLKGEVYVGLDPDAKTIEVGGTFIDILSSHGTLGVDEPVIVLEASSQLVYAPLGSIEELSF